MKKKKENEIRVYDRHDTTSFIDRKKKLALSDFGIELPPDTPTKVISVRVPTPLLNRIKAYAGDHDVPYAAMIKLLLAEGMDTKLRKASRTGI